VFTTLLLCNRLINAFLKKGVVNMIKLIKAEVEHLKAQRAVRDIWVAQQLWDWFEKEQRVGMMQCIRTLVGKGLDQLNDWLKDGTAQLIDKDPKKNKDMGTFLKDECKGLDLWESKGQQVPTLDMFQKLSGRTADWWDIGKCGGFFRMYGTFFEYFGKDNPQWAQRLLFKEGQDSWKQHTSTGRTPGLPFGKYSPLKGRTGEAETTFRETHPRAREGGQSAQIPKVVDGLVHRPYGAGSGTPGVTLFKLLEWSTIKKIDTLYGLPEGADISGTTCDHLFGIYHTIYLMETGSSTPKSIKFTAGTFPADLDYINDRKPLIILLPLVQMIREYHHSLLESAAALSLNDMIDYKIGFYSSLLALDYTRTYDKQGKLGIKVVPWRPTNIPLAGTVRKLLVDAEKAAPHMYCCSYDDKTKDTEVVGYLLDKSNEEEVKKFKASARLGPETYNNFYKLPDKITMSYIESKMQSVGLLK
jgi:hypothetical protein